MMMLYPLLLTGALQAFSQDLLYTVLFYIYSTFCNAENSYHRF